jgi:hypothetical protein
MKSLYRLTLSLVVLLGIGLSLPATAARPGGKRPQLGNTCGACVKKGIFKASPLPNGGPILNAPTEADIPKALEITRTGIVFRAVGSLPFGPPTQLQGSETPTQFIPAAGGGLVHESSVDPVADGLSVWVEIEVQTGMSATSDAGDAVGAAYVVWVEEDTDGDGAFTCGAPDSCGYLAQNPGFFGTVAADPYPGGAPSPALTAFYTQAYPSLRHYFRASRKRHRIRVDGSCSNLVPVPTLSGCLFDYSLLKVSSGVAAP